MSASPLRDRIEREADMHDVELDAVRQIETDSPGTTMRVLGVDAEDEADQIGFQVTKPPGEIGNQMFSDKLEDGMKQLRRLLDGEEPTSTASIDPDDESDEQFEEQASTTSDEKTSSEPPQASERSESQAVPLETFHLDVEVSDESFEAIEAELTRVLEAYDERSVDAEDVAELEDRIESLEERITSLEQTLSMLGNVGE